MSAGVHVSTALVYLWLPRELEKMTVNAAPPRLLPDICVCVCACITCFGMKLLAAWSVEEEIVKHCITCPETSSLRVCFSAGLLVLWSSPLTCHTPGLHRACHAVEDYSSWWSYIFHLQRKVLNGCSTYPVRRNGTRLPNGGQDCQ